eukprot:1657010-Rhodomonas_salina.1
MDHLRSEVGEELEAMGKLVNLSAQEVCQLQQDFGRRMDEVATMAVQAISLVRSEEYGLREKMEAMHQSAESQMRAGFEEEKQRCARKNDKGTPSNGAGLANHTSRVNGIHEKRP